MREKRESCGVRKPIDYCHGLGTIATRGRKRSVAGVVIGLTFVAALARLCGARIAEPAHAGSRMPLWVDDTPLMPADRGSGASSTSSVDDAPPHRKKRSSGALSTQPGPDERIRDRPDPGEPSASIRLVTTAVLRFG